MSRDSLRRFVAGLLVLSALVGGSRLFTGVIYLADEPTALLVIKREPAL